MAGQDPEWKYRNGKIATSRGVVIDGGLTVAGGAVRPPLVAASTASFTAVSNTTADTTLASLAIPANTIAAGDVVCFETGGTLLNNSGGSVNHTIRFKLGATTVLTTPVISLGTNVADREWYVRAVILHPTTSTQKVSAVLSYALPDTANWGGGSASPVGYGTAAEATTVNLDVTLSVQPGTASALQSMQATWALLRRL